MKATANYKQDNNKKGNKLDDLDDDITDIGETEEADLALKGGQGGGLPLEADLALKGGQGGGLPLEADLALEGGQGGDAPLDTSWLDNFKQAEQAYNEFYKEPIHSITLFFLYVNKDNEVEHLHNDKYILHEHGVIKRETIISLIKEYRDLFSIHYKLLSLIKYNIDLESTDIYDFINESSSASDKRFIKSEKYLNDIHFEDSIHMFQDLNALFFIFYEEQSSHSSHHTHTKRVKLSSHSKTKRNNHNNHMIKKNLKILKHIS